MDNWLISSALSYLFIDMNSSHNFQIQFTVISSCNYLQSPQMFDMKSVLCQVTRSASLTFDISFLLCYDSVFILRSTLK